MGAALDITGQRFNRLLVIRFSERRGKRNDRLWECVCDCGNSLTTTAGALRSGNPQSCGCRQREAARKVCVDKTTHGMSQTRLHNIWHSMKQRCYYDKHIGWEVYGGRGIRICDAWLHSFEPFMEWAFANGYSSKLTIDRIDVNGNYEPSNCRWISMKAQCNNKRNNKFLTYLGVTKTIKQWSEETGLGHTTICHRMRAGYCTSDILSVEKNKFTRGISP